ncbi:hypothetical protein [Paraconexibacter sp.]|uniref:hypothetical protein n=1 Tax=Paraconexibacter sp. TaxID=2949640 RepID=UPI0035674AF0
MASSAVVPFFVPRFRHDATAAEAAYGELSDTAEHLTGATAHRRRIRSMSCRLGGRDVVLDIGSEDAIEGQTVTAIFQVGRVGFTVHTETTHAPDQRAAFALPRTHVYDVTDFAA